MFRNGSYSISLSMPVLEHIKRVFQAEFGNDFSKLPNRDNTLFVIIQHGFISIRPMMEAFLELGIHPDQVFMTTKPHTTPTYPDPIPPAERHPDDMLHYFKTNFKHYVEFEWKTAAATPTESDAQATVKKSRYKVLTDATHDKLFEDFCNYLIRYPDLPNRRIENIIICDEGGKFLSKFIEHYHRPSNTARRNLHDYHVVAIEHTKCGTYRQELIDLPFPLINMADSYLKTQIESQFIAESMFVHLNAILQKIMHSSSMTIGVVGGGNIGKEVLVFLSENYSDIPVLIFDRARDVLPLSEITALGWGNVRREETIEALFQQATVILGCTGKDFMAGLSTDCFARNQANHIHLVSCSSGDTEFNTLLQQMPDYKFKSLTDIRDYSMPIDGVGEKKITLYNGGFPMNFLIEQPAGVPVEETVPLHQVQITRSMKLAAIVQALKLLEVTAYSPKKYDNSLKDYMKLDVIYQWQIIQAFYADLMQANPHNQAQITDGSMGVHQPTMSSVLNIPYYITTKYQVKMQDQLLEQNDVPIKILVLHGTTGSGKTTLAQHYLQKHRMQHPERLSRTILAETALQWRDQLRQWAEELSNSFSALIKAKQDPIEQERLIKKHLREKLQLSEWCIVIDNWDENEVGIEDIEEIFSNLHQDNITINKGILLITTQGKPPYPDRSQSLDLSFGLSSKESKALVMNMINVDKKTRHLGSDQTLQLLVDLLGKLPLALVIAASYLLWENKSRDESEEPFTYEDYIKMLDEPISKLDEEYDRLKGKGHIPRDLSRKEFRRIKTQEAAVNLSLKKAIQTDSSNPNMNLWQLLCFCGFLASNDIPQKLLKDHITNILPEDMREADKIIFSMLLKEAQKYSLLQFESRPSAVDSLKSLHMHRVIQKVLRDIYWPLLSAVTTIERVNDAAKRALTQPFTYIVNKQCFLLMKEYFYHVEHWYGYCKTGVFGTALSIINISLGSDLSLACVQFGDYIKAKKIASVVLEDTIAHYGVEDCIEVADAQEGYAGVLVRLGFYTEAEENYRKTLAIKKRLFDNASIHIAESHISLAIVLAHQNRYEEAKELYQKALPIKIKEYGEKHIAVARVQQNLAITLARLNQYQEAEELYWKALAIKIIEHGDEHIEVSTTLVNLACALNALQRYLEAEVHYKKALIIRSKHYGENHIEVIGVKINIAILKASKREFFSSLQLIDECQKLLELQDGYIEHKNNCQLLRQVISEQQHIERPACPLCVSSDMDSITFTKLINLFKKYQTSTHYKAAINSQSEYYDETHVRVAKGQHQLALMHIEKKNYSEAIKLLRETIIILGNIYHSQRHIEVAKVQLDLATALIEFHKNKNFTQNMSLKPTSSGADFNAEFHEAKQIYQKVLPIYIKHYGQSHLSVIIAKMNYGILIARFEDDHRESALRLLEYCEQELSAQEGGQTYLKCCQSNKEAVQRGFKIKLLLGNLFLKNSPIEAQQGKRILLNNNLSLSDKNEELRIATHNSDFIIMLILLDSGVEINSADSDSGLTALHIATIMKYTDGVTLLLAYSASPHVTDKKNKTSINLSKDLECSEITFLLEQGVLAHSEVSHMKHVGLDLFSFYKSNEPDKIIRRAANEGHRDNLFILLNKYPELLNAIDQNPKKGWTALHWTIYNGHTGCVVELLNRNAHYGIPDKTTDAVTAIDIAIEKSNPEICEALAKHIIKKYIKTNDHDSEMALRVAASKGDLPATKLLISQGVNIDAAGPKSGKTALHQAVQMKHHSIVEFLLNTGANTNIEDSLGKKAVEYADSDEQLITLFSTPLNTSKMKK